MDVVFGAQDGLVRDGEQRLVGNVEGALRAKAVEIVFRDGSVSAQVVGGGSKGKSAKASKPAGKSRRGGQGSLF